MHREPKRWLALWNKNWQWYRFLHTWYRWAGPVEWWDWFGCRWSLTSERENHRASSRRPTRRHDAAVVEEVAKRQNDSRTSCLQSTYASTYKYVTKSQHRRQTYRSSQDVNETFGFLFETRPRSPLNFLRPRHYKNKPRDCLKTETTSLVFPLIEVGSHIQAGSLIIQAGGLTAFVPIQAGSPIAAGV